MEDIPRGIEILVKKASVDPAFRKLLLETRADAAREIGLELEPTEIAMIDNVPESQLQSIILKTIVLPRHRAAFLGKVAAAMLLTLGTLSLESCNVTTGIEPDQPEVEKEEEEQRNEGPAPAGERPDRPPSTRGISPR
jgi:hypothetical protein